MSISNSSASDDSSSSIDDLNYRSRKLTKLLKQNVNKSEKRKSVLDVVKSKAWLLEDQVKLLENQTSNIRSGLRRQSCLRKLVVYGLLVLAFILAINSSIFGWLYNAIDSLLKRLIRPSSSHTTHHKI